MPKELLLVFLVFVLGVSLLVLMRWNERPAQKGKLYRKGKPVTWRQALLSAIRKKLRRRFYWGSYLKSGYWNQLKLEIKAAHPYCEDCGSTQDLDVHHGFYYVNGKSVLYHEREYRGCLIVLCRTCHKRRHSRAKAN